MRVRECIPVQVFTILSLAQDRGCAYVDAGA